MSHLLVTNDFPPKVGGIQTYLWELWRRMPPGECTVLTTRWAGSEPFDAAAPMRIVRVDEKVLLPTRALAERVRSLAQDTGASFVVLDPALPLGKIGPRLGIPYAVVLHGAEVTVPARLPFLRRDLARVLRDADLLIAAGGYPEAEARRLLETAASRGGPRRARGPVSMTGPARGWRSRRVPPFVAVPPGVDPEEFAVLDEEARAAARHHFGIPEGVDLVVSVSRLVPRKGMDTLIAAAARLAQGRLAQGRLAQGRLAQGRLAQGRLAQGRPELLVAIAGDGRDRGRLERLVRRHGAPVRLLGRVPTSELPRLYGCADLFVMACRDRWMGLEQEGFGIVFLEAASCGVPQIAGRSGGSAEAVLDGTTGVVLRRSDDASELASSISLLLDDHRLRTSMGEASRRRVEGSFGYDLLAVSLLAALRDQGSHR